ncbi:MAG TPA: TspO/MBR family protein [Phenylobacterium sp.]|jgi:tryptophan-rich sensory protein|uniref:TspO/MBR family protein n=1 Tax=Phenylobacterium sp. TaxID=1871053 RepID=UPI002D4B285E|nr:TspO/MBR family protein [Phenylobacterium sp.]HZZ67643.1 TspO/MBR family protein [Phenylobacterium sp.]
MPENPVRGAVDSLANSRGRSTQHILIGLGLAVGAVAISALVARLNAPPEDNYEAYSDYDAPMVVEIEPQSRVFAKVWPPLFMALTLSGLRIWNAPRSAARTQALTLWGAVQGLNAAWMALGPKRLGGQLATAIASLGTAAAYVWRARQVDPPAANLVAPYVGWIGFANVLSEGLARRPAPAHTMH